MIKAKITIFDDETGRIFMENNDVLPISTVRDPKTMTTKYRFKEFIVAVTNEIEVNK